MSEGRSRVRAAGRWCELPVRWCLVGVIVCASLLAAGAARAAGADAAMRARADTLVAAYLFNFVKYVEWPASEPPGGAPWRIGVLGADRLRGPLQAVVAGKTVRGRPLLIEVASDPADLGHCQVILLPPSPPEAVVKAVDAFSTQPVLTVYLSDKDAAPSGAAIELVMLDQNLRYRLHAGRLEAAGLRATQGLLDNALPQAGATAGRGR